ncbi:hypothetical protein FRC96_03195 [Lujinxingia vulgaris]|uniref:Uncharacterized protein n=1 Tax=Lujinxingia vulgaris TaxID=2600176 RepID=A0A5C6XGA6_9DELT|nr:hypothetical protein [Lujinxingia vulgaris]TXD42686.1 hypothetical protein FRC96_03195 [Lujinxingia vulgaris]
MFDEFSPIYTTWLRIFSHPNPPAPRMRWPLWAWVNIASLGSMLVMGWALSRVSLPPFLAESWLILAIWGSCILGPPIAAGLLDGRGRTGVTITASGWAFLLGSFIALTLSESWQNDCGLGQGFAMLFATIGAAIYPLVVAAAFVPGRLAHRLRVR